jgi:glycine oxidase
MILVAGAGVFGSSIALVLAQGGFDVVLADPAAIGDNASGVAAGMLAPAFEAVLDSVSAGHFPLLRDARDRWPAFAARLSGRDVGLIRAGAVWVGAQSETAALEVALVSIGAGAERHDGRLFTPEDWRLEARLGLAAIQDAALAAGARRVRSGVIGFEAGRARLADGQRIVADALVLATGAAALGLAPETDDLSPIAGQLLRFDLAGSCAHSPTRRFTGGYRVDTDHGVLIGATMEPGRTADPAAARQLNAIAKAHFPELAGLEPAINWGVRAGTKDGLPLVGPSSRPGILVAVGARRNGWLLAPLVAEMTAAYLAGADPGGYARAFDPRRFERAAGRS